MTAKIESLLRSGRCPVSFATPCPSPFPVTPPFPIATRAWYV